MLSIATTVLALAPSVASVSQAGSGPWRVGQPLPHIHLPTVDDRREIDLDGFRGRKLLLIEFASW